MTNDDFDPRVLRRVDAPRRPSPEAAESIRAAMLAAFDDEIGEIDNIDEEKEPSQEGGVDAGPADGSPGPIRGRHLEIVLDPATSGAGARRGRRTESLAVRRVARYGAVAALFVAAIAGIIAVRASDSAVPLDPVDANLEVVTQFCVTDVDPLVDVLLDFDTRQSGELSDSALRNGELLVQRYRDLASALSGDLAVEVAATGDALLEQAADARREFSRTLDDAVITALIDDTVVAIRALPGSAACRLDGLQDSST